MSLRDEDRFGPQLAATLDELDDEPDDEPDGGRWPLPDGRQPCAPCRGYDDHCAPLGCSGAVLDELLWALFGWLWLAGGRSELETWTPDETRVAGVDVDELEWCDDCGKVLTGDRWLVGLDSQLCDACYAIWERCSCR